MRKELQKQLDASKKESLRLSGDYRRLLKLAAKTNEEVRGACNIASEAANITSALELAVKSLPEEVKKGE